MARLICTVRRCAEPLTREGRTLRCPKGHAFDRARQGYWNLLQPQDRRSTDAGDRRTAVEARGRWLERGHLAGLAEAIRGLGDIDALEAGATLLDVGCGDGWFGAWFGDGRELDICGIDLSPRAVARAARRVPSADWVVANADRGLPVADESVDVALSIFGRRPVAELSRVLHPDGAAVVVVPAEDDLIELREAAQGRAVTSDRVPRVAAEFEGSPLRLIRQETWRRVERYDRRGIDDLLAMTYRGARHRDRERLEQALLESPTLQVTLAAHLLRFER